MKNFFIIGTDTDCGKTHVTVQLIEYLSNKSRKVTAIKPVASGCYEKNGELISEDAKALQCFSNSQNSLKDICPWRLRKFISPHLAARDDNVELLASDIASFCLSREVEPSDYLLIEGAGGLIVPLNDNETWLDVLKLTSVPVVLVVGMKLGCINHTLLTVSSLKINQIPFVGWIANCIDENMSHLDENIATLTSKIQEPLLGIVPFGEPIQIMQNNIF
ncbi:MAG: dethiobiotin synthase [Legionellaceae bacterium]|nr:dethiobiotin synthase [Legionellaceae bacterium]